MPHRLYRIILTPAREFLSRRGGGVVLVHLAIDDWMGQLFCPDLPQPLDFGWVMERAARCERRIWLMALAIVRGGGRAVLDLGFMKAAGRSRFLALADEHGLSAKLHYVTAERDVRCQRVSQRNAARGDTFSFEVTPAMFDAMEALFEPATAEELALAAVVATG
ncbi:ATP-binding protein [Chromobacterium vaccinii]|nr:ATP-binding protein [Chromobacterium vaccinii]MBX9357211.1 ATP-binding protein [Chromobacterium vaccinii]